MTVKLAIYIATAYVARFTLRTVSVMMLVLPRRRKVTMLTREHTRPPLDFVLLRESILRQDPSIEVVIIARQVPRGVLPKLGYGLHLFVELFHVGTSRVLIVERYSLVASVASHGRGLTIVQLWHALGALKKFGHSIVGRGEGQDPRLARAIGVHRNYDLVVASAERCRAHFAEAFDTDLAHVVVAPLPRVDRLRDPVARDRARARFAKRHPELAGRRIALFAPTFRRGSGQPVDLAELTRAMGDHGYALVTKLHPLNATPSDTEVITAPGVSTLDLILVADVFITDYSSTLFEAAVAGVPSYLLATDLERYTASRDFYLRYPEDLDLPLATTVDELVAAIAASPDVDARTADLVSRFVEMERSTPTANADAIASMVRARARLE